MCSLITIISHKLRFLIYILIFILRSRYTRAHNLEERIVPINQLSNYYISWKKKIVVETSNTIRS